MASTIDSVRDVDKVAAGLVIGGAVVSLVALYEARTHYNVFDHLDAWLLLPQTSARSPRYAGQIACALVRSASNRPRGRADHGRAPLAMYLAQKAARGPKAIFWNVAGGFSWSAPSPRSPAP